MNSGALGTHESIGIQIHGPPTLPSSSPAAAYHYAQLVIDHRKPYEWATHPLITNAVSKDGYWTIRYCEHIIGRRLPEAEKLFTTWDPWWIVSYAIRVVKGRWIEAEEHILKSEYKTLYAKEFPEVMDEWLVLGHVDWLDR